MRALSPRLSPPPSRSLAPSASLESRFSNPTSRIPLLGSSLWTQDAEHKKKAKEEQAEREFMEALKKQEEKMWEKSRQKR